MTMGLLVETEPDHLGRGIRIQTLGRIELNDCFFYPTLIRQSMPESIVRRIVALGDIQRMPPETLAVMPISKLMTGDNAKGEQDQKRGHS